MPISPQITVTPEDIVVKNFDITAVTRTSTTATYTAIGHTFSAGDIVLVSGIFPDGYNGTFTLSSVATNTFTVSNATNLPITDPVGNAFWADAAEYEYEDLSAVYAADSDDLETIDEELAIIDGELATIEIAVNGKNKIYRQATAPTGDLTEGDVWFDTDDGNKQYYWTGTAWVSVRDLGIAAAEAGAIAAENAAAAATAAAASATAAAAAAASAATAAQTTADGKNKIYRQTTQPSGGTYVEGDLWFDTDDDNKFYRFTSGAWSPFTLGNNALASISANKLTAGTIDASVITVSNINAGNISTGVLNADRIQAASITGAKLVAGTIEAVSIAAGTITGAKLAVGTIEAVSIAAGTITGTKIAASTITAGNIATATITADQIAGATITAAEIAGETITAAEIAADSITVDRLTAGTLTAFTLRTSSGARRVTVSAASNAVSFMEASSVVGWVGPASTSGIVMHYGTTFNANATTYPNAYVASGGAQIAYSSGIYCQVNSTGVVMNGDVYTLDAFYNQDSSTSANESNTRMDSNGRTRRSTFSSARFKDDITDIANVPEMAPSKLLSIPIRAFKFKPDYLDPTDNRAGAMVPGFIAEEVAEHYPIAADLNDGVVENWNSRFIIPGMLALIQDLHARVTTLEGA